MKEGSLTTTEEFFKLKRKQDVKKLKHILEHKADTGEWLPDEKKGEVLVFEDFRTPIKGRV